MIRKIAIIEFGSNSIRTANFLAKDNSFEELSLNRTPLRLINNLGHSKQIEAATAEAVIKIIIDFQKQLTVDTEIHAIATAALRTADNQAEFVQLVRDRTNIEIEIINSDKEAYYDYLAVNYKLGLQDVLIADIGGGSTEIIAVKDGELLHEVSLPFGGVNLTNRFFSNIPVGVTELQNAQEYLQESLNKLDWLQDFQQPMVLLGGSGIVLFKLMKSDDFVKPAVLQAKSKELQQLDMKQLQDLKEIPTGIIDILNGGLTIVNEIIKYANPKKVTTIKASVREGYLLEKLKSTQ